MVIILDLVIVTSIVDVELSSYCYFLAFVNNAFKIEN